MTPERRAELVRLIRKAQGIIRRGEMVLKSNRPVRKGSEGSDVKAGVVAAKADLIRLRALLAGESPKVKVSLQPMEEGTQIDIELPTICPACGRDFSEGGLWEQQYVLSEQQCRIVDGRVDEHGAYTDFAQGAPVIGYRCECGEELTP